MRLHSRNPRIMFISSVSSSPEESSASIPTTAAISSWSYAALHEFNREIGLAAALAAAFKMGTLVVLVLVLAATSMLELVILELFDILLQSPQDETSADDGAAVCGSTNGARRNSLTHQDSCGP